MAEMKIEETLGKFLLHNGLSIATAESCTGGLIANRITDIPGSSEYFLGGVVSYSYESKMNWLGVKEKTLADFGAVSQETVQEMVLGLSQMLNPICDLTRLMTMAVSGIAGPGGGTPLKPVGTVWMAWAFNGKVKTSVFQFHGERTSIKAQSADQALNSALKFLQDEWINLDV
jgi:PncC family amidohydrolase